MPSIREQRTVLNDDRILDMLMDAINRCFWQRERRGVREGMDYAATIHPSRKTTKFRQWYEKAAKLRAWLYLPENSSLWSKTVPYERCTKEYHLWRIACLERDNWQCQVCDSVKELNVHHIKQYKDYPSLRLDRDNGITVCESCHKQAHKNG